MIELQGDQVIHEPHTLLQITTDGRDILLRTRGSYFLQRAHMTVSTEREIRFTPDEWRELVMEGAKFMTEIGH